MREYYIVSPGRVRRTWRLICRVRGKGSQTVRDGRIEGVNAAWLRGELTQEAARLEMRAILQGYQANRVGRERKAGSPENQAAVEAYVRERLARKPNKDPYAARWHVESAIRALGGVSLRSGPIDAIQTILGENCKGAAKQRRRANAVNTLLAFVGRKERVFLMRREKREIRTIRLPDLLKLLVGRPKEFRLLALTAFGTGARVGEVFALTEKNWVPGGKFLSIGWQMDKRGQIVERKNAPKEAGPLVLKECEGWVREWMALDAGVKAGLRGKPHSRWLGGGLTFHNLRHSYVFELTRMGLSLDDIALCIGDSRAVVEQNYRGWAQTDASREAILRKLGEK